MFIAHLPAALLLAPCLPGPAQKRLPRAAFLFGALAPNLDLLRFYLIDAGQLHHHSYLTHRPAFWLALLLTGLALPALRRAPWLAALAAGALLHLALDSVTGAIAWGWPLSAAPITLIEVPPRPGPWILTFLLHQSFAIELAICLAAALRWRRTQTTKPPPSVF